MTEELNNQVQEQPEYELNHTDKLVGVFTEPGHTFSTVSHFPVKTVDWIVPLLLLMFVAIISSILIMSNPVIHQKMIEQQREQMQKMVDEGIVTQEQADQQMGMAEQFMSGPIFYVIQAVSVIFGLTIFFFVVTGFYYLLIKLFLKGEGGFKNILVAYGLPLYIAVIQGIIVVILSLAMDKMVTGINLTTFVDLELHQLIKFLITKIDPFSIWFYVAFGIAAAKMFKSEKTGAYIGLVTGVWIVANIVFYFVAQSFPMVGKFIGLE